MGGCGQLCCCFIVATVAPHPSWYKTRATAPRHSVCKGDGAESSCEDQELLDAGGGPVVAESRADDQSFRHSPQPHSTNGSPGGILAAGMEGIYTQYPTGFSCDVCGGIAVVDVDDGDHYLCSAHAIEPMMEIDLTGGEPIVTIADGPAPASDVISTGAPSAAPDVVIADAAVRELLTDVVSGLRAIRRRLDSTPIS